MFLISRIIAFKCVKVTKNDHYGVMVLTITIHFVDDLGLMFNFCALIICDNLTMEGVIELDFTRRILLDVGTRTIQ